MIALISTKPLHRRRDGAGLPSAGRARRADNSPKGARPAVLLPFGRRDTLQDVVDVAIICLGGAAMVGLVVLDLFGVFGW